MRMMPCNQKNLVFRMSGLNPKSQITNIKWFDKLTTLSPVEGQITMTKIQNSKPVYDLEERTFQFAKAVRLFVKTSILEKSK